MALDVAALGRKTFISQSGLSEVLQAIKKSGQIPEATSKSTVKRRREDAVSIETPYGQLIQMMKAETLGGTFIEIPYCSPAALLWHTSRRCHRMREFLDSAAAKHENSLNSKWKLAVYLDEVSPGNQLKVHNRRKLQACYFSIVEFGGYNLSQEHAWCVLACVRTDLVNQLKDGLTQLFKLWIKAFFCESGNLSAGISLQINGMDRMMAFSLGYIVADEAAIKHAFENKGAAGKMLCLFCQTTIQKRYAPAVLGMLVPHTEVDHSNLILHTDHSIWQVVDHLHAEYMAGLSKKEFSDLETRLGFNYTPHGVLLDHDLRAIVRPISQTCFDPMHVYLVAGIWHREVSLLMNVLAADGYRQPSLHDFLFKFHLANDSRWSILSCEEFFQKEKGTRCRIQMRSK